MRHRRRVRGRIDGWSGCEEPRVGGSVTRNWRPTNKTNRMITRIAEVYYESEGRKTAPGEEGCLDHGRLPKMTDEASAKRGRKTDRLTRIALGLTAGVYLWLAFSLHARFTAMHDRRCIRRLLADRQRENNWLDLSID